ncbi:MAG: glycosyltransferase family 2 protein, partial [Selenomonadaceae bacterium]|nr:glycosyltransferase family 2 protein [Selenomonadaceae bacterium]
MKISACYIVKNEQENIRHSIESLKNQYDELIVVDTGSEDGTVDVVRSLGGNVFTYKWQDDFAAARNFALAKATGDWLIFLDADEYFSAATAGNLRRVLEMASPEVDGMLVDMVNFDADTGEVQEHFYQA